MPKLKEQNLESLVCLVDRFKKTLFVNNKCYVNKIDISKNKFSLGIQWIKYYNDLVYLLVYFKYFQDLYEIDSYNVKIKEEAKWFWKVSYYNVIIKWKLKNQDYMNLISQFNKIWIKKNKKNKVWTWSKK